MTGAAAEAYRDEISRRTRRGLEGRARAAQPTGGRAYGYVAGKDSPSGQMQVHLAQAETVRSIFQWFADGKSPRWIAGELNRARGALPWLCLAAHAAPAAGRFGP